MTSDISEQMDEYCQEKYGHTNWGYLSTYEDHELKHAEECGATYDTENNIIFWHHDLEEEDNDSKWTYCKQCDDEFLDDEKCNCEE